MKDPLHCCICGRSTRHGGFWNGVTDREYCHDCALTHGFDDDQGNGQTLLEAFDDS